MGTEIILLNEIEIAEAKFSIEKKIKGIPVILWKTDQVKIFSDNKDVTESYPIIAMLAKSLSRNSFALDGLIKEDKLYAWDITYFDTDITSLTLAERLEYLKKLNFNDKILEIERKIVNLVELKETINWASKDSEGAVIKELNETYFDSNWKQLKNLIPLTVSVLKTIPKDRGFNYLVGIESNKESDPDYVQNGKLTLGHTFNTDKEFKIGDKIELLAEEIWKHEDKKGTHFSIHKPRVIDKTDQELSDLTYLTRHSHAP